MCGRFAISNPKQITGRFNIQNELPKIQPTYNAVPGMLLPVIYDNNPRKADLMKWGLVPYWAKDITIGMRMINARADSLEIKPSFRRAFNRTRCVIPSTGFYEWKYIEAEKVKIPYYIHRKDGEMFAFAGLYDIWKDAEGKEIFSFTIITTEPNFILLPIHTRMPVILLKKDEDAWLDPNTSPYTLTRFLRPYPSGDLEIYKISNAVNNPDNDGPDLIKIYNIEQQSLYMSKADYP